MGGVLKDIADKVGKASVSGHNAPSGIAYIADEALRHHRQVRRFQHGHVREAVPGCDGKTDPHPGCKSADALALVDLGRKAVDLAAVGIHRKARPLNSPGYAGRSGFRVLRGRIDHDPFDPVDLFRRTERTKIPFRLPKGMKMRRRGRACILGPVGVLLAVTKKDAAPAQKRLAASDAFHGL